MLKLRKNTVRQSATMQLSTASMARRLEVEQKLSLRRKAAWQSVMLQLPVALQERQDIIRLPEKRPQ